MLVGNDVVDLRDPESRPEAIHNRFDARVFTSDERKALSASAAAHELRWTLWAAKESAYKVAKKLDPTVRFLPRDFVVGQIAEGRALVMHATGPFDVRLYRTDRWVSAVATLTVAHPSRTRGPFSAGRLGAGPINTGPINTAVERLATHGADPGGDLGQNS